MYITRDVISSGFSFAPYAGILPCPLVVVAIRSSSFLAEVVFEVRSKADGSNLNIFAMAGLPFPSLPWQVEHFWLNSVFTASSAAKLGNVAVMRLNRVMICFFIHRCGSLS